MNSLLGVGKYDLVWLYFTGCLVPNTNGVYQPHHTCGALTRYVQSNNTVIKNNKTTSLNLLSYFLRIL